MHGTLCDKLKDQRQDHPTKPNELQHIQTNYNISVLTYSILNWGRANKTTLLPLITLQNKAVRTLEYNKTKTTTVYSIPSTKF